MTCDRCGRKINHIYITEDHEKICDRTCKGRRRLGVKFDELIDSKSIDEPSTSKHQFLIKRDPPDCHKL
jgi:hypothetical protein